MLCPAHVNTQLAAQQAPSHKASAAPRQESRTYWFNAGSLEGEDAFMLVGLVLGLAIYNAVLLDFPLPLALYRKLLGQPAGLRDLQDMDPTLGKSLRQLLDYDGARARPSAASTCYILAVAPVWTTRGVVLTLGRPLRQLLASPCASCSTTTVRALAPRQPAHAFLAVAPM